MTEKIVDKKGNEVPSTKCPRCDALNPMVRKPEGNRNLRYVAGIVYEMTETVCYMCGLYFKDALVEMRT
jgi:hypothetical protein